MDTRAHERQGSAVHGMVVGPRLLAAGLIACVALSLLAGISGGLLRVGVIVPGAADTAWLPRAALAHAALMIGGFLGTVIGIERATAAKQPLAWVAPAASGLAGVCLLLGAEPIARGLLVLAAVVFSGVNVALLQRQWASHTALLVASALSWAVGNVLFAFDVGASAVPAWWFAFLIMTIAAERLEMTRLMRRRPAAQPLLFLVLGALVLGAGSSAVWPGAGGVLFGAALVALAAWLLAFDIARRTVRAEGLSRFMAICLLGGYAWLAIGGVAWAATALGLPARDAALHALGLGFIVSMIMGHAPVILPAIARVKLQFGNFFYLPLVVLHASLLLRLVAGWPRPDWRAQGAVLNAAAIVLFALTVIGALIAWRVRAAPSRT
jgi:hypothetical protein